MFDKIINFIEGEWYRPAVIVLAMTLVLIFTVLLGLEREEKRILLQEKTWIKQGYPIGEVIKRNEKIEAIKNEIRN